MTIFSRRGYDWTQQFRRIAEAADFLRDRDVVLDGEAVWRDGLPEYQQLRRELGPRSSERLNYLVFDSFYLDGYDGIRLCEPLRAAGERVFEHTRASSALKASSPRAPIRATAQAVSDGRIGRS